MITWLSIALGLVKLLNMVGGFLGDAEKTQTATALSEAENLKNDLAAVHSATAARNGVNVSPDVLRLPNADSRT